MVSTTNYLKAVLKLKVNDSILISIRRRVGKHFYKYARRRCVLLELIRYAMHVSKRVDQATKKVKRGVYFLHM